MGSPGQRAQLLLVGAAIILGSLIFIGVATALHDVWLDWVPRRAAKVTLAIVALSGAGLAAAAFVWGPSWLLIVLGVAVAYFVGGKATEM